MRILAIDPGERIGFCVGEIHEYAEGGTKLDIISHGITPLKPFLMKLDEAFPTYDVVLYEKWVLFASHAKKLIGSDMQSSQAVGVIRALGWKHPHVKLVGQRPAVMATAAKALPADIQAILDTLPKAHDERHNESALLHLYYYYFKRFV